MFYFVKVLFIVWELGSLFDFLGGGFFSFKISCVIVMCWGLKMVKN